MTEKESVVSKESLVSEEKLPSLPSLIARLVFGLLFYAGLLFASAGSWKYWPAWIFMTAVFLPILFVVPYLYHYHPRLLIRRMKMREKESEQKVLVAMLSIVWIGGLIVAGLDFRFGWSHLPITFVVATNLVVTFSYLAIVWVFTINEYAARTVEVEPGQKVISTGPYGIVRHPMYSFVLLLIVVMPLGLGSLWFFFISIIFLPLILIFRILNEEKVLRKELEGYNEYCDKVHFRLIPFVW